MNGIDLFKPATFVEQLRITLLGLGLAAVTIVAMYIFPAVFTFVPPSPGIWALIIIMFAITMVSIHYILRRKLIVKSLWQLAEA